MAIKKKNHPGHGKQFPECKNAEEYGKKANDLLDNLPEGSEVIEYYDEAGNKKKTVYDPKSNTLAIAYVDEKDNGPKKPAEEEKKPEEPLALPPGKESGNKKPEESKNDPQINKSTVIPEHEKGFPGWNPGNRPIPVKFMNINDVKCPVCDNYSFNSGDFPGSYLICEICGWEDDSVQYNNPDYKGGANELSLNEAKENWKYKQKYGFKVTYLEVYDQNSYC
ncbi:unnamed protein product [Rotaria magnacalcarata]|uniref:Cysteine-rich CPCC domain-containing protein n=1 Tax=Rotaria magnacalcarata TaxID=392030 RepID=A0A816R0K5_9BILA|nr:unnamed protein product [Rotaria magnacalcarata]